MAGIMSSNKAVVFELLELGFGRGDRSVFDRLVAEDYIQHSAFLPTGRKGLLALFDHLRTQEGNEFRPVRVMEDGPLVVLHAEWNTADTRRALFDLFRVDKGWLVEHWDVIQEQPAATASGRTMLDGASTVIDADRTASNKALVENFVRHVLLERQYERLAEFFNEDHCIQHSPQIGDGVAAFHTHISAGANGTGASHRALHRIVGEGNFVLAQCEGSQGGARCALYDLFRVEHGKIAEHWDVVQPIPPTLPHDNGFF
jgi:predicted SnoaL-like aldol condensation-catalyzing enzyme